MDLDEVKLVLENESEFHRLYHLQTNRETTSGTSGQSVGVCRRSLIKKFAIEHGKRLTMFDTIELERYFNERYELCPYGLVSKAEMETRRVLREGRAVCKAVDDLVDTHNEIPTEENIMADHTKPAIETKVLIYGVDAKNVSDAEIFSHIARIENEIKALDAIKTKPKKLVAQIEAMQAEIEALVALVDVR